MFDIGWTELLIVGVIALIVIGPKELPGVLRMAGQWIGKVRRMASDFQGQFQEAMREAEMADLKQQVDEFADSTRDLTSDFDPIGSLEDAIDDTSRASKVADSDSTEASAEVERSALPPPDDTLPETEPAQTAEQPAKPSTEASTSEASASENSASDADATPPPKTAAGGASA